MRATAKGWMFALVVALAGCGGGEEASKAEASKTGSADPVVTWNFSTWGKPRAFTVTAERLAEIVGERSGGHFTIKVHYGEALSKARETLDGIQLGAFEAGYFCNFYHPGKNPAFMVLALPFLPLENWEVSQAVRKAVYEHPAAKADMARWNAMTFVSTLLPQYEFLGREKPPTALEDWHGLRVRAGGGIGDAMQVLGAVPVTVPAPEVYTGLQRGTMDAVSLPFTYSHVAYKIHEVSDWYTTNLTPGTSDCPMVFSIKAWEALPEKYRQYIREAEPELVRAQIEAYVVQDRENLPMLEEELTPVTYSDEQLAEFRREAGQPVWDRWVAENSDDFDAAGLLQLVFDTAEQVKSQQQQQR